MRVLAVLAPLFAAAAAQRIKIFAPTSGETLTQGQSVIVSVVEAVSIAPSSAESCLLTEAKLKITQNSLTNIEEIGIGIALRHCNSNPCAEDDVFLGRVLYSGSYSPQFDPATFNMPNQNFTVTIPDIGSGPAVLSVAHASFVGVSTD